MVVHVMTFSSPAGGTPSVAENVVLHDCGPMAGSLLSRRRGRARFRRTLDGWIGTNRPRAILAACPFGYIEALRVRADDTPVIFMYYEMYDARLRDFSRSPATIFRNWLALSRLSRASLVCTPSAERAAWLLGRANLERLPQVVLNSPSVRSGERAPAPGDFTPLLPPELRGRPIVVNTGGVTPSRCVRELVCSVEHWTSDAALVVTNMGHTPYADDVRQAAAASSSRNRIALLPLIPRAQMIALQRAASVGISLLRGEDLDTMLPAPNKLAEYVHAGLLAVTSPSSFTERMADRGVAVIADSLHPHELARSIDVAVARSSDAATREHVLRAAREWYCMDVQLSPVLNTLGYA
jgi:hypothetical protein